MASFRMVVVADGVLYSAGTPNGKLTKAKGKTWQFKQDDRTVDITIEPNDDGTALMVAGSVAFGKNTIKAKLEKSKKK